MAFPYEPGDAGERRLTSLLEDFRTELRDYHGAINELKMGLRPEKTPSKPGTLSAYEMTQKFDLPLVSGGLVDQPYIWLLQVEIIQQEIELQEMIERNTSPRNQMGPS